MSRLLDEAQVIAAYASSDWHALRRHGSTRPLSDIIFAHFKPLIDRFSETCGLLADNRNLLDETRKQLDETHARLNETLTELSITGEYLTNLRRQAAIVEEVARNNTIEDTFLLAAIDDMREVLAHSYF